MPKPSSCLTFRETAYSPVLKGLLIPATGLKKLIVHAMAAGDLVIVGVGCPFYVTITSLSCSHMRRIRRLRVPISKPEMSNSSISHRPAIKTTILFSLAMVTNKQIKPKNIFRLKKNIYFSLDYFYS